jgi:hypothetical protein
MKSNGALVLFVLVTVIWLAAGHPIHQDLSYHHFANHRTIFGIPNAANVLSNIPFLVVGALGLVYAAGQDGLWRWLWGGLILTGFGSGFYHLNPGNATLIWDRLPMSITFAAVICIFVRDGLKQATPPLWLWLVYSIATVVYWAATDDLRPYVVLQFGGMVFVATVWILRRTALRGWGWVLAGYLAAKVLEAADHQIWDFTHGLVGGHAWKHVAAAAGFVPLLAQRRAGKFENNIVK